MARKFETPFNVSVRIGQRNSMEVRRQRSALVHFGGQADEEILALAVEAGERPDHVADVGADAEFRHATDVDGDFHAGEFNHRGRAGRSDFGVALGGRRKEKPNVPGSR